MSTGEEEDPQAVFETLSRFKGVMRTNSTESTVSNTKFKTEVDKNVKKQKEIYQQCVK